MDNLQTFYGPNAVDPVTRAVFERWSPEQTSPVQIAASSAQGVEMREETGVAPVQIAHVVAASALAHAIRERGHLGAHLDPLGSEPLGDPALLPETHGISEAEIGRAHV